MSELLKIKKTLKTVTRAKQPTPKAKIIFKSKDLIGELLTKLSKKPERLRAELLVAARNQNLNPQTRELIGELLVLDTKRLARFVNSFVGQSLPVVEFYDVYERKKQPVVNDEESEDEEIGEYNEDITNYDDVNDRALDEEDDAEIAYNDDDENIPQPKIDNFYQAVSFSGKRTKLVDTLREPVYEQSKMNYPEREFSMAELRRKLDLGPFQPEIKYSETPIPAIFRKVPWVKYPVQATLVLPASEVDLMKELTNTFFKIRDQDGVEKKWYIPKPEFFNRLFGKLEWDGHPKYGFVKSGIYKFRMVYSTPRGNLIFTKKYFDKMKTFLVGTKDKYEQIKKSELTKFKENLIYELEIKFELGGLSKQHADDVIRLWSSDNINTGEAVNRIGVFSTLIRYKTSFVDNVNKNLVDIKRWNKSDLKSAFVEFAPELARESSYNMHLLEKAHGVFVDGYINFLYDIDNPFVRKNNILVSYPRINLIYSADDVETESEYVQMDNAENQTEFSDDEIEEDIKSPTSLTAELFADLDLEDDYCATCGKIIEDEGISSPDGSKLYQYCSLKCVV